MMRKTTLYLSISLLYLPFLCAQTSISGIINDYQAVIDIDTCTSEIMVADASNFQIGMKVLLLQMQGANIDESNSASFGDIVALNQVGSFEKAEIRSISGNSIFLKHKLLKNYPPATTTQLVSIPQYQEAIVTAPLEAQAWNGSTGGVLVFEVAETLTLNAPISVTGKGFRGGNGSSISPNNCSWLFDPSAYYYDLNDWRGAPKGEGIAALLTDKEVGRGAQANGGGGGNDHNAGGGGGANRQAGGQGGRNNEPSNFGCRGINPGLGGKAIPTPTSRLFLGGGGGAGHTNNDLGTPGGNGGGIIIIQANTIQGNGFSITADGEAVTEEALGDGAGGGGAGGTILLNANQIENTNLYARGGNGGNVNNNGNARCMGPGGGGSGGAIFVDANALSNSSSDLVGGLPGLSINSTACSDGNNSATAGQAGQAQMSATIPSGNIEVINSEILDQSPILAACFGDTSNLFVEAIGNNLNYQWQVNEQGTFEDLVNNERYLNVNTPNLSITGITMLQNNISFRCIISSSCEAPLISAPIITTVNTIPLTSFDVVVNDELAQFDNQSTSNATSYIWDFGDNTALVFDENPSHSYNQNGSYEVQLISSNECGADTTSNTIDIFIVNTQTILDQSFELYPNPIKDVLQLTWKGNTKELLTLQIFNSNGVILRSEERFTNAKSTSFSFNLKQLPKGLYVLQLRSAQGIAIKKFVKQ